MRKPEKQILADDEIQDGVAQKFEAFIVVNGLALVLIRIRRVRERRIQEFHILDGDVVVLCKLSHSREPCLLLVSHFNLRSDGGQ